MHRNSMLIKIRPDATLCGYLCTIKSLYIFWVSQHPSPGVLKTVTAASGTGHNVGTATSLQRVNRSSSRYGLKLPHDVALHNSSNSSLPKSLLSSRLEDSSDASDFD